MVGLYVGFTGTSGGKRRPVLIIQRENKELLFLKLTSKYQQKSVTMQRQYYPLKDWESVGLNRQTFVDVGQLLRVELSELGRVTFIGRLSQQDKIDLAKFIQDFYS